MMKKTLELIKSYTICKIKYRLIQYTILFVCIFVISCHFNEVSMKEIDTIQSYNYELYLILLEETKTNVYVLSNDNKECIIIDPALKAEKIANTLKSKDYDLKAIFLTHNHWDHSKEINILSDIMDVPIVTNDKQIEMGKTRIGIPITSDNLIKVYDKQIISFADMEFEIIFTPGHSKGSMCFFHEDSNSLFSGDTLFKGSIGRTDFPGSVKREMSNSLKKLINAIEKDTHIYPGHMDATTKKDEVENNPFLQ